MKSQKTTTRLASSQAVDIKVHPDDEATAYAVSVVSGKVMAGPHVRNACARHIRDLKEGHRRGLVWSLPHAQRVMRFFRMILKLNGGDFEGKAFNPLPWQCFILGSLFGWLRAPAGFDLRSTTAPPDVLAAMVEAGLYRRFHVAYQETGKGSGKSPLAAGVGLYGMVADNEPRAEIYAAATKKDQAMILFRDAVAMVEQSKSLAAIIKKSGKAPNVWNLAYHETASFFRPIAAEDGQSGPRPHMGLMDEVHEHKTPHVIEMVRAGFKFRKQPLLFMITNSGADKTSVCYDYHEYGAKVCAGVLEDDSFFAYICAHDKDEDPFTDESIWSKSNPSLGHTIDMAYLRKQVLQARGMASKESIVRRLHFCQWVQSYDPWVSSDLWEKNSAAPIPLSSLRGAKCTAGLDLSMKNDLSTLVLTFEHDDGTISVHPFFWVPEEGIKDKEDTDRVPYTAWARAGFITLVPGATIDYAFIAHQICEVLDEHDLMVLNFDRYKIADLIRELARLGREWQEGEGPLKPYGQGYKDMSPAIEAVEDKLREGKIRHGNHPVLKWCVGNAVTTADPAELRKFDKARATGRMDGAVGLAMAVRGLVASDDNGDLDEFLSNPLVLG